jgi:hypothetical protein
MIVTRKRIPHKFLMDRKPTETPTVPLWLLACHLKTMLAPLVYDQWNLFGLILHFIEVALLAIDQD